MNKTIKYMIIVVITILILNFFIGTTSLDQQFNKEFYSAMYYANIYDDINDMQGKTMVVGIDVKRNVLYQRKIFLTYIYYENNDIEFKEPSLPILEVGKRVKVNFEDADYTDEMPDSINIYVELTNNKYEGK